MNYSAWFALGELVDNSISSYLKNRSRLTRREGKDYSLRVVIEVSSADQGSIRVWDNAAGIDSRDYTRAFVTAEPPPDPSALSQFGIGMKSACCWFAREWRVRTTALGEAVERTVEFDVPRIIRDRIETLDASLRSADESDHYTEVRLWNLYKSPQTQTVGKIRRHIASMYRQFMRHGDVRIEFNDERLSYKEPKVLVAPFYKDPDGPDQHWHKEVSVSLGAGAQASGFVALRERGSTKEAGLSLYRERRLIVGSDDDSYRPAAIFGGPNSYASQRLFGELEITGPPVSHTKDGFIWGELEQDLWRALRKEIDRAPLPLIKQAEGFRARKSSTDLGRAATRALSNTVSALPAARSVIETQAKATKRIDKPATSYGRTSVSQTRALELKVRGQLWRVAIETSTDPAATDWVKVKESKKGRLGRDLGILLSLSHPFTQRFGGAGEELEGLVRLAVGLGIAEITAREAGVTMAGVIRRNLNELLGGALSQA